MGFFGKLYDQINLFDNGKSWGNQGKPSGGGGGGGGWGDSGSGILGLGMNPYPAPSASYDQSSVDAQLRAIMNSVNNYKTYAPKMDFAGLNAQARANAEGATNPYYVKMLNDFLAKQAVEKKQTTTQAETDITNLQDTLKNTMEGNVITKTRTGEDASLNQANINTAADEFQTDSGQEFTADRLQQAKELSQAGLTGGLGAQQVEASQANRNVKEKRQEAQFQQKRNAVELAKTRTFEDLSRSDVLATQSKDKNVKQVNVGLSDFIENQGVALTGAKSGIEKERQLAVLENQRSQYEILKNNWIDSIANPASRDAARQAYR